MEDWADVVAEVQADWVDVAGMAGKTGLVDSLHRNAHPGELRDTELGVGV